MTHPAAGISTSSAQLASELADLFPAGVIAAQMYGSGTRGLLQPQEAGCIGRWAQKRIDEFAAGRLCARQALAELGIRDFALLPGADRLPIWPQHVVGSITHTDGYCAVVVAEQRHVRSLGVDSEAVEAVREPLWRRICTPAEMANLQGLPGHLRQRGAALAFAAKEAFYKCQYPLAREWVGFGDVAIESGDWMAESGCFCVRPQRALKVEGLVTAELCGQFRFHEQLVTAGLACTAEH